MFFEFVQMEQRADGSGFKAGDCVCEVDEEDEDDAPVADEDAPAEPT